MQANTGDKQSGRSESDEYGVNWLVEAVLLASAHTSRSKKTARGGALRKQGGRPGERIGREVSAG